MANTSSYVIVTDNAVDNPTDDTTYVFNPTATLKTFTLGGASDGDTIAVDAASTDFRVRFLNNEFTLVGRKGTPSAGVLVKVQMDPAGGTDRITFLDGTVDVTFTPSAGSGLGGKWEFGGHDVAGRRINLAKINVDKDPTYTYADAEYEATGILNSDTYLLTGDTDAIEIAAPNTYDKVIGTIDRGEDFFGDGDKSTWTLADTIEGNGRTHLQIAVADLYGEDYDAPFSFIDGVDRLSLINGDEGEDPVLTIDGAIMGDDLSIIDLAGDDGLRVEVEDLVATGDFHVKIAGGTTGTIEVAGASGATHDIIGTPEGFFTLGDLNAGVYLENNDANSVDAHVKLGTGGIDVILGKNAYAEVGLSRYKCSTVEDVSLGDIGVGNINIEIGVCATAETVLIDNSACASGHDATVGNITVGDVHVSVLECGCGYLSIENEAYVTGGAVGDAKTGNVTVGNIAINLTNELTGDGDDYLDICAFYVDICNSAEMCADKGDATVGNLSIGNIELSGNGCISIDLSNEVTNCCVGDATAGKVTIGNIEMVNGTDDYFYIEVEHTACAETGNATVGDMVIGNISMTASYENSISIELTASVDYTGNATIGNVSIGNISMKALGTGTNEISLSLEACVYAPTYAGGSATIGNVTIGNIEMMVASSTNCMTICAYAYIDSTKVHDASIGNLTIGNLSMSQLPGDSDDAVNCLYIERCAYNSGSGDAMVGNVVIGNVSINDGIALTQTSATNYLTVCNYAYAGSGDATVGAITIGNVTANTANDGYACICLVNSADGASGADVAGVITIGNINMAAIGDGEMVVFACNTADEGLASGVKVGNVSIMSDAVDTGSACFCIEQFGESVGNISVGNVSLLADDVYFCVYNCAEYDDAGSITIGNMVIAGENANSISVYNCASDGSVGAITMGNVTATAGVGDCFYLSVYNCADDVVGAVTIKDIVLNVESDATTGADSYACVYVYTTGGNVNGGNITVGNITINASGNATDVNGSGSYNASGCVSLSAEDGTVTVGNITVNGGVVSDNDLIDGFEDLSYWLSLSAKNDAITIGNVDYSGYAGKGDAFTLIDVSGYAGAAVIKGATGGATITDNDGTNAITLSNTAKDDTVVLQEDQDWITNSTTTGVAGKGDLAVTLASVDSITGFAVGDVITTETGIGGDSTLIQADATITWAQFLTNAENQIDNEGHAGYSAYIGGNTYLALAGDDDVVQTIVKIVGKVTLELDGDNIEFQSVA